MSVLRLVVSSLFALAVFGLLLPRLLSYHDVVSAARSLTGVQALTLVALMMARWVAMGAVYSSVLPGLGLARGVQAFLGCNVVMSTMPGPIDLAVRHRIYRGWGFSGDRVAASIVAAGVCSSATKLLVPIVALTAAATTHAGAPRLAITVISASIAVLILAGCVVVHRLTKERTRRAACVVNDAILILRRRWLSIGCANGAAVVVSVLLLTSSLRHVGVGAADVPWPTVLSAYALVQLASLLPISVGNVGVAELVLLGSLGRSPERDAVAAGVILYRCVTFALPLPVGAIMLLRCRRRRDELGGGGRATSGVADPVGLP